MEIRLEFSDAELCLREARVQTGGNYEEENSTSEEIHR